MAPGPTLLPAGDPREVELTALRARLAIADETLRAIRSGEVDSMVVAGKQGDKIFTLEGAGDAYRLLIESMNEGAVTLTANKMILYANRCFARMVKCPLEQVTGSSFRRFLSVADRESLRPLMKRASRTGAKIQLELITNDGALLPVQISVHELSQEGFNRVTISMVVTDLTEAHRSEKLLRALSHRVVQVQETERARVALDLHDNITQLLCAVLFQSQALVDSLSPGDGPAKETATRLHTMLGQTADEVERISRDLRPNTLDQLGLVAALLTAGTQFTKRVGVSVELLDKSLNTTLPANIKLALYRIFQEALCNVEKHAHARHVTVNLSLKARIVRMTVKDDGIGFDRAEHAARRNGQGVLGLLGMSERATSAGGVLTVKSGPRVGTEIAVRIPLPIPVA